MPVAEAPTTQSGEDRFEPSGLAPTWEPLAGDTVALDSSQDQTTAAAATDSADSAAGSHSDSKAQAEEKKTDRGPTKELSPEERQMVSQLQLRDREVRAHEAAHKAAGGAYVGGASYTFQQGPDGRQYAIGGEVPVDLSTSGGSPEAVIAKMEQVRAAALAPGDPSSQDYAVAAAADAIAAQARRDQQAAETKELEEQDEQRASAGSKLGQSTTDGQDEATPLSGTEQAPTDAGLLQGRALGAYRKAQVPQVAQGLLNQVA
jgi:hypothetical protein